MPVPALVWQKQQEKRAKRAEARASVADGAGEGGDDGRTVQGWRRRESRNSTAGPGRGEGKMEDKVGEAAPEAENVERKDYAELEKAKTAEDGGGPPPPTAGEDDDGDESTMSKLFSVKSIRESRPIRWMAPTKVSAHLQYKHGKEEGEGAGEDAGEDKTDRYITYRARDERKGRGPEDKVEPPAPQKVAKGARNVAKGVWRMFTYFPYWEMAWWSGWTYTFGSALFVISACFGWTSLQWPDTEFQGETVHGVPLTFFIGAVLYQIGAVASYFEAINTGPFHSSAMGNILKGHLLEELDSWDERFHKFFGRQRSRKSSSESETHHHHKIREKIVDPEHGLTTSSNHQFADDIAEGKTMPYRKWHWWPSWYMLRTHHIYEIGYIAVTIQLFGVTLYGVTAVIIFPRILNTFVEPWQINVGYWIPQMVAAAAFLTASIMFTIEMQDKWWKPDLRALGWHIGFWSIIGSIGFELSADFGPTSWTKDWAEYQVDMSSFWGSIAYLIGSGLQWYESVNKHPVAEGFDPSS